MAKEKVSKTSRKSTSTAKKTVKSGGKSSNSNKITRKDQMECSNLIMIGTAVVIILVLSYISIEYFVF